ARGLVGTTSLQFLETVLADVVVTLARTVVVGRHLSLTLSKHLVGSGLGLTLLLLARVTHNGPWLCPVRAGAILPCPGSSYRQIFGLSLLEVFWLQWSRAGRKDVLQSLIRLVLVADWGVVGRFRADLCYRRLCSRD